MEIPNTIVRSYKCDVVFLRNCTRCCYRRDVCTTPTAAADYRNFRNTRRDCRFPGMPPNECLCFFHKSKFSTANSILCGRCGNISLLNTPIKCEIFHAYLRFRNRTAAFSVNLSVIFLNHDQFCKVPGTDCDRSCMVPDIYLLPSACFSRCQRFALTSLTTISDSVG